MQENFDVSLLVGPNDTLWVSAYSRHGAVHGVPRTGSHLPSLAELADMTEDFEDAIQYARPFGGPDVGAALRDLIFGEPDIAALFHRGRGAAADHGRQVVVRILAAPASLAAVPWELMLDPEGGSHQYLTLAPDAHVVRSARSRTYPLSPAPLPPPLNVLLILSSPVRWKDDADARLFDLFEEKRILLQELEALQRQDLLRIDIEEHPTLENLRGRIGSRRGGYHIVHYVGHAVSKGLYLEDRSGNAVLTPVDDITELLRLCPQLRLSLFAGCETARRPVVDDPPPREWRDGLSTADQCARVSCPNVIGMRAVLPFRTEGFFARYFYQGLASGYAVVDAVRLARLAIRGDEFVGGQLLDWAVPSLIAGSEQYGPLLEPPAPRSLPPRPRPVELKFDIVEEDREFFARLAPLRQAIDVLGGNSLGRILVVNGPAGVGKTSLVDRALQDLSARVDCVLYFKAARLRGANDPILRLAGWVGELLTMFDREPRALPPKLDGADWWERLLGEVTTRRFVIAIDDVQELSADELAPLARALRRLADRRGGCRLALIGSDLPAGLVDSRAGYTMTLGLRAFTWDEIWVWVRRNLPILTRYGKAGLSECYAQLGNDLAAWRDLGKRLGLNGAADLQSLVDSVADSRRRTAPAAVRESPPVQTRPPRVRGKRAGISGSEKGGGGGLEKGGDAKAKPALVPRTQRALRVAVAGPSIRDPGAFAKAMTKLAAKHGVGGRVVTSDYLAASTLAELVPVASPFLDDGTATGPAILVWLKTVTDLDADIVLLDYGSQFADEAQKRAIARLATTDTLFIAAAGHEGPTGKLLFPASFDETLAVGALTPQGTLTDYSPLEPERGKPEIHAGETLLGTPLESALRDPATRGSSPASIRVAAAAALVWSINPARDHHWLRQILLDSARTFEHERTGVRLRELDIDAALTLARGSALLDALGDTEATYADLQGRVGFSVEIMDRLLQNLVEQGKLRMREDLGSPWYRAVDPVSAAPAAVRPPSRPPRKKPPRKPTRTKRS